MRREISDNQVTNYNFITSFSLLLKAYKNVSMKLFRKGTTEIISNTEPHGHFKKAKEISFIISLVVVYVLRLLKLLLTIT